MSENNSIPTTNGRHDTLASYVAELQTISERLQDLAEKIRIRELEDADMRSNYPFFKKYVYDHAKIGWEPLPPIPEDMDLQSYADSIGWVSSEEVTRALEAIQDEA